MREKDEGTKNETENNGVRRRVHDEGTRVGGEEQMREKMRYKTEGGKTGVQK